MEHFCKKKKQYDNSLRAQENTKPTVAFISKEKESPSIPDHARTGHTTAGNSRAGQKSVLMRPTEKQESMKNTDRQGENRPNRDKQRKRDPEF